MPDDDVLNLTRLVEAYETDKVAIAKLLTLAKATEKRYIAALRTAINRSDLREVARAAHSIKGSASNIGADQVSRIAAHIEDRARQTSWDGIADLADELDGSYDELCARIVQYAAKIA